MLVQNALRFPISFVVPIVRGAPVGEGAPVFGWLKWVDCMKALSAFFLALLVPFSQRLRLVERSSHEG